MKIFIEFQIGLLILGGEIVSTFDAPEKVRLGKCDLIEEIIIGEDKLIKFSGFLSDPKIVFEK